MYCRFLYFVLQVFFFLSCNTNELDVKRYIEFVRDEKNKLSSQKIQNNYAFKIQYQPAEYLTLKEIHGQHLSKDLFEKELEKFKDYFYLTFSINSLDNVSPILNKEDTITFDNRLNYFSFHVSSDIYLLQDKDTFYCVLHQLENTNYVTPECRIEMMFKKPDLTIASNLIFCYDDKILNIGKVEIPLNISSITSIPKLKI